LLNNIRHHPRMRVTHFPFPENKLGRPDKPGDDECGWREKRGVTWVARFRGP
jgi:hypothetical protein